MTAGGTKSSRSSAFTTQAANHIPKACNIPASLQCQEFAAIARMRSLLIVLLVRHA